VTVATRYTNGALEAEGLPRDKLPRHVAIIMDGNGRWAQRKGLPRIEGHRRGVKSVRLAVEECARLGLEQLTLYCLSSENWKRPRRELDFARQQRVRATVAPGRSPWLTWCGCSARGRT